MNKDLRMRSVATIDGPEFINVVPANPNISQCEVKVCYVGKNRNGSYIDKDTLAKMANTLPGSPIVGAFRDDVQDFGDHGEKIVIEDGEIKFSVKTRPYGFVAPDAQVWFQKFVDTDEFGNEVEREYLMTTGYLWTGQYEEARAVLEQGRSQSMELDDKEIQGHWAKDAQTGLEFFIINDAVFTKLCILGEDVEPCFEGASVTGPEVSANFAKDESFTKTLFSMMNELKDALSDKGGLNMPEDNIIADEEVVETSFEETENAEEIQDECLDNEPADAPETETTEETEELAPATEVAEEEAAADECAAEAVEEAPAAPEEPQFTLDQYNALVAENEALKSEVESLRAFRLSVEDKEKDALIAKYFMISDEDKAEIVAHKSEYSLGEIEAKLALIYVNKNVDFSEVSALENDEEEAAPASTFNLDNEVEGINVSNIVRALRSTAKVR